MLYYCIYVIHFTIRSFLKYVDVPIKYRILNFYYIVYYIIKAEYIFFLNLYSFSFGFATIISVKVALSGLRRTFDSVKTSFVFLNNTVQCVYNKQKKEHCCLRFLYDTRYYTRNRGVVTGLIRNGKRKDHKTFCSPGVTVADRCLSKDL